MPKLPQKPYANTMRNLVMALWLILLRLIGTEREKDLRA